MKRDTKNEILNEALLLFAENGYEGVTVRDIAEKLGIKASSLYKHYSGKQAIFEGIVEKVNLEYTRFIKEISLPSGNVGERAVKYGHTPLSAVESFGVSLFKYWTEDKYASAFRHMLILEQYRNNSMKTLYHQYLVKGVIDYQTELFGEMINRGYFSGNDPLQLALDFYGPIFTLMTIYDGSDNPDKILDTVVDHIENFGKRYIKESGHS